MSVEVGLITGLALGAEYIEANDEAGIQNSCIIIDLLILRIVLEFTGE
jgi:hypothetical protein